MRNEWKMTNEKLKRSYLVGNLLRFAFGEYGQSLLSSFSDSRIIGIIMALPFPFLLDFARFANHKSLDNTFLVFQFILFGHGNYRM